MQAREIALDKFLCKRKDREDVIGAMVCGSYITGNPSPHSDIDIRIILDEDIKRRERGNEIIDGFLIEYFANPPYKEIEYMENDYKNNIHIDAHMYLTGRVIFDKKGKIKELKNFAKQLTNKKFQKLGKDSVDFIKYSVIRDGLDGLKELFEGNYKYLDFAYQNQLYQIFDYYSKFVRYYNVPFIRLEKTLTDEKYRQKYLIPEFPDKDFVKLFLQCLESSSKEEKLKNIEKLTKYVLDKMGGFEVDGFKLRTDISK